MTPTCFVFVTAFLCCCSFYAVTSSRTFSPSTMISGGSTVSRDVLLESIGKLQRQIIKENIPIFSFQKDLSIILNIAADNSFSDELVPIESLAHEYLSLLRDYYFDIFTKRLSEATLDIEAEKGLSTNITAYHESIWRAYIDISGHCLREFEVAKNSSLPSSPICDSWYTQGYLIELMDDMKSHVSSVIPFPASIELPYASAQSDGDGSAYSNLTPSVHVQSKRSRSAWWTRVKRRFQQKHKRVVKYGKWLAVQMLLFLINFGQNELNRRIARHQANKRLAEVPGFPLL